MRAVYYIKNTNDPIKLDNIPTAELPEPSDTVVLTDGRYHISAVEITDDPNPKAKIEITPNKVAA